MGNRERPQLRRCIGLEITLWRMRGSAKARCVRALFRKKLFIINELNCVAEREGFEPSVGCYPTHAFQAWNLLLYKASIGRCYVVVA